jgi:hypothetical protein
MQYIPDQNASRARDAALQLSGLPTKSNIILIRWPVVLVGCVLILLTTRATPLAPLLNAFAVLYALSNAGLYFVSEATFRELKFNVWLIGVDTLVFDRLFDHQWTGWAAFLPCLFSAHYHLLNL